MHKSIKTHLIREVFTMNGKYIKTKRVVVPMLTVLMSASLLFGCGVATQEEATQLIQETPTVEVVVNEPIEDIAVVEDEKQSSSIPWIEVGKLETNPELRKEFDLIFGVTGEAGAKDGWVYQNSDQNITLYKAFEDENTILVIYGLEDEELGIVNENRPKLAESAGASYVDADDLSTDERIAVVMDGYFNLLPDAEAGYSNPYETLTRAQAMTMLMRAMTPVSDIEANADFTNAVGGHDYNIYAQEVADYALLNVENGGLDISTYANGMTKAEAVYMITQALYKDDYTVYVGTQSRFDDLEMAENFTGSTDAEIFAEMIATGKVDSRIYAAYCVAEAHNIFPDEMTESEWSENITKAEFINYLVRAMAEKNYPGCTQGYITEAMAEELAAKMDAEADKDPHNQSVTQQQQQTQQPTQQQQNQNPPQNNEPVDPNIDQQYQDMIDQGIITIADPSNNSGPFDEW